ncbi:xanthine dehydrogenase family protein molybdopterin-binding subunit [Luteimonas abyssi]|uniref:xanthine dehydrogenase family protein molybdopterin-binding subunit n=1 Tax=Luteimonas abyssi TaxID=1247514 RepID=UPI000737AE54|nr:xanthine dehydrogenase family protein molybdopterin-binding subunit [Luteimonas abyssi]
MSRLQNALIDGARALLRRVPARWLPGGTPDPLIERRSALGGGTPRRDAAPKVRGHARFAAEVPMDGLLYAAFVHATVARGTIAALATDAADAAEGVVLVMTYRNAPRLALPPAIGLSDLSAAGNNMLPVMQDPQIRWNGQVVAVVLAETQEQADHAAGLVEVDCVAEPARTRFEAGKADATMPASILIERNPLVIGDAEAALAASAHRVDALYRTPWQNHHPIEPNAATVYWDDGRLVLHDATQMLNATAGSLAKVFGLKRDQVRVVSPYVGGAFGSKGLWDHQILACAAAKLAGRPVRIVLSRAAMHRLIGGRSPTEQRFALGADADGRLQALIHTGYSVKPPHSACDEQFSLTGRTLYAAKTFRVEQRHIDLDVLANTYMRAPGEAVGSFAMESALDELACAMALDPIELRRRNVAGCDPVSGAPHSQRDLMAAYAMGAERFGWSRRSVVPGARRDGEWRIGMGCASGTFPYARMPGMSVRIALAADGRATVTSAAHEMGMGTATVQAQHAADRLGLPLERVTVAIGDTRLPFGSSAGGSSQTASLGAAITAASDKLTVALLRLAARDGPLAGLKPAEVTLADGGVRCIDDPSRHQTYAEILRQAGEAEISTIGKSGPPLELLKFSMHSSAAMFCEVRVSEVTGEVRVSRMVGAFDCGRILNPRTAASQFRGGIVMGLGLALMEETWFDERNGRIVSASLADYHVPAHLDVPPIDVLWTDIPDPRAPMGARGIGEVGITGVAAAVANAVFNATGKRVRDLPITLDKVIG